MPPFPGALFTLARLGRVNGFVEPDLHEINGRRIAYTGCRGAPAEPLVKDDCAPAFSRKGDRGNTKDNRQFCNHIIFRTKT